MIASQDQMREFVERARQIPVEQLFFAEPEPEPESWVNLHPYFRFILPLTGEKEVRYAAHGRINTRLLLPGDVVIGRPGAWIDELWNRRHEMISVVFYDKYVRVLYIGHDGQQLPPRGPDIFFHSIQPPDAAMKATIQALLTGNPHSQAVRFNLLALLEMVQDLLNHEQENSLSAEDRLWNRIFDHLQYTFCNNVSREEIAEKMGVHPARLSRMIHTYTGLSIRGYLNQMRLEYATRLLRDSRLPVEEIAVRCGFQYPSYFIRLFRDSHRCSPGEFRRQVMEAGERTGK